MWVRRSSPWGQAGIAGFCLVDLKSVFRIGLENVIFLWAELRKWREKNLVLLISQKDYEHIKKYEIWDMD